MNAFVSTLKPGQNGFRFCRRHFQMHFIYWKVAYVDSNFTKVWTWWLNWEYFSNVSGNIFVRLGDKRLPEPDDNPSNWRIYVTRLQCIICMASINMVIRRLPLFYHKASPEISLDFNLCITPRHAGHFNIGNPPKYMTNPNLTKPRSSMASITVVQS